MVLPTAEAALQEVLGDQFGATSIWHRVLNQIMGCQTADEALKVLADGRAQFDSPMPVASSALSDAPPQLTSAEKELVEAVCAAMPTFDDLVDPPEECDMGQSQFEFQNNADIIAAFHHEKAVKGELCQQLEKICLAKGQVDQSMVLAKELQQFCAHVQWDELLNSKQITLAEAWGMKPID
ncbi:hypothetical protein B0H13DRAFT_1924160 [Mycena leptocephala]|nr:hypothetical protein B0H13DRAFT_1924160 [Mycena leptocephala]